MKKLAVLLTLLSLCLCACGEEAAPAVTDTVAVWYVSGSSGAAVLEKLAEEYNALPEQTMPVRLRAFSHEELMAEAFNSLHPDLMLCTEDRMEALTAHDLALVSPELEAALRGKLRSGFDCCGGRFLPFGGEVSVLLSAVGVKANGLTLPELRALAEEYNSFFLAVSSYRCLFTSVMPEVGGRLTGSFASDAKDEAFASVYNLFADMAYSGKLRLCSDPLTAALEHEIPCAVVSSAALGGKELSGFDVSALSMTDGKKELVLLSVPGLAITAEPERDISAASAFLRWLTEGDRLGTVAIQRGLIPAGEYSAYSEGLSAGLDTICKEYTFRISECAVPPAFEDEVRAALLRLY